MTAKARPDRKKVLELVKSKLYLVDLRRPFPTNTPAPSSTSLPERFISKVRVDPESGCWNWTAALTEMGYGRFANNGGMKASPRIIKAHRFAFEQVIGRLPKRSKLVLDHLCRNPACCNPWHLEPVTRSENARRGASANPDGYCRRGIHSLNETGRTSLGACAECRRILDRKRRPRGKKINTVPADSKTGHDCTLAGMGSKP